MQPQDFPLAWPAERERTPPPRRVAGRFKTTFQAAWDALVHETEKLHDAQDRDVVISTNVPLSADGLPVVALSRKPIADPGVCVYVWREGRPYALACDTYIEVRHNMRALWATIQALRTVQRHATGTLLAQSMAGFAREIETTVNSYAPFEVTRKVKQIAGR